MKGAIICCLQDLVVKKFGPDKWKKIHVSVGQAENQMLTEPQDVDDAVIKVIGSVCKTTWAALMQAVDAFDDYRGIVYSSRFFNPYYIKHKTARNFLLAMEDLHVKTSILVGHVSPAVQLSDSGQSLGVFPDGGTQQKTRGNVDRFDALMYGGE